MTKIAPDAVSMCVRWPGGVEGISHFLNARYLVQYLRDLSTLGPENDVIIVWIRDKP